MNLNLYPIIEREKQSLLDIIKNKADFQFVQEDLYYLRELDDKFAVSLEGLKLLYYFEGGTTIATLWHRIVVYSHKKDISAQGVLVGILSAINLTHFHDEDSHGGGIFLGKTDYGTDFAYCYVNPDYPKGYWENHVLEVEPDLE